MPSTTVTASHVTQGIGEYESTIPRSSDEGLALWEASGRLSGFETNVGRRPVLKLMLVDDSFHEQNHLCVLVLS